MDRKVLVVDPITDAHETASEAKVMYASAYGWDYSETVRGDAVRRLYDSPTAESYGEGSYTVSLVDFRGAIDWTLRATANAQMRIYQRPCSDLARDARSGAWISADAWTALPAPVRAEYEELMWTVDARPTAVRIRERKHDDWLSGYHARMQAAVEARSVLAGER